MSHAPVPDHPAALHGSLAGIAGVDRVILGDGPTGGGAWLLCDPHEDYDRIEKDAGRLLEEANVDPDGFPIEIVIPANRRERRVKFESVERIENPDRSISVRTTLTWDGQLFEAEATGEKGDAIELRTAAQSTLQAVEQVTGEPLNLRLVGVKHLRAFDGELVVVSIYGGPGKKTLLGVVLAGPDPYRATAVAVLMALNRLLGNYLATR